MNCGFGLVGQQTNRVDRIGWDTPDTDRFGSVFGEGTFFFGFGFGLTRLAGFFLTTGVRISKRRNRISEPSLCNAIYPLDGLQPVTTPMGFLFLLIHSVIVPLLLTFL